MQLLYSNILPLGIEEDQKTIIDAFHEQLQLADRVEIAVGYTSYASLEELDNLIDAYQANLFAADLLINDEEIEDMVQNEDLDYFGLCSSLNATPELMSFKLYSLTKRGQAYHMPMEIQSNFLAK